MNYDYWDGIFTGIAVAVAALGLVERWLV